MREKINLSRIPKVKMAKTNKINFAIHVAALNDIYRVGHRWAHGPVTLGTGPGSDVNVTMGVTHSNLIVCDCNALVPVIGRSSLGFNLLLGLSSKLPRINLKREEFDKTFT
jgi:hypothetical protein